MTRLDRGALRFALLGGPASHLLDGAAGRHGSDDGLAAAGGATEVFVARGQQARAALEWFPTGSTRPAGGLHPYTNGVDTVRVSRAVVDCVHLDTLWSWGAHQLTEKLSIRASRCLASVAVEADPRFLCCVCMDDATKKALIDYVVDQETTPAGTQRIKEFCEEQPAVSMTVYRGHAHSRTIRPKSTWYSSTKLLRVAKEEFSSGNCCTFAIHLVNVPVIHVNRVVRGLIKDYEEEEEIIFLGGGRFYTTQTMETEGFVEKRDGHFECWYALAGDRRRSSSSRRRGSFDLARAVSRIPSDEYEFIDDPADVGAADPTLTSRQRRLVFNRIKSLRARRVSSGGTRRKAGGRTKRGTRRG